MQTQIAEFIKDTDAGLRADSILRKCVHCGFCNATCPTYTLLGNELDGPRGRIYLIKQMLEGKQATARTQIHLDRCLTCLNCETTCPSGVRYGQLLDIGRELAEQQVARPLQERLMRFLLRKILPYPSRFGPVLAVARLLKPALPGRLARKIPDRRSVYQSGKPVHAREVVIVDGCVQSSMTPEVNTAATNVLSNLGINTCSVAKAGCCGALNYHLGEMDESIGFIKQNIDAWWPRLESNAEAIVVTASGCGQFIKQYGDILRNDRKYSTRAERISSACKDISEIVSQEDLESLRIDTSKKIAYHSPCTMQHGQKLGGLVETILQSVGYTLVSVNDAHICCGSAGTYSILQQQYSNRLLKNKLANLEENSPDLIATANIGCQLHLQSESSIPVRHWVELLTSDSETPA